MQLNRYICVDNLTINGSDNGLSPGRRQAIIWTNAGILVTGPLGTNFSEISIAILIFSFKKMHLKMSSGKCWPCCLGLNVLTDWSLVVPCGPYIPSFDIFFKMKILSTHLTLSSANNSHFIHASICLLLDVTVTYILCRLVNYVSLLTLTIVLLQKILVSNELSFMPMIIQAPSRLEEWMKISLFSITSLSECEWENEFFSITMTVLVCCYYWNISVIDWNIDYGRKTTCP